MNEIPTFENIINSELTKFDSVIPAIAELSSEFMPLRINGIDDAEGYEKVSKALRFMVSKRVAVEEKRKELKADSLTFGRAVDNRAKEISTMLSPIEEHLKSQKQKIDEAIEQIKIREEQIKQIKIDERSKSLNHVGMFLIGTEFIYANNNDSNYIFPRINLEIYSDTDFEEYILKVRSFHNDNLEKYKKLKILEEAYNKLKQDRTKSRNTELLNLGLGVISWNNFWLYFPDKENTMQYYQIISFDEVENIEAEDWDNKFTEIKKMISDYDDMYKKSIEKLVEEEIFKREKELSEQAKEEQSNLSDKDKFDGYIKSLISYPKPELSTKKWSNYIVAVIKSLETFTKI